MSLIASTEQLRTGRPLARTLLLLIALTGAVILGLLAMHSLNTHATARSDHDAAMTIEPSAAGVGESHAATATAIAPATADSCVDCGTSHPGMVALACVLAVLAVVFLLAQPLATQRWLSLIPRSGPGAASPPGGNRLRPPSLTALCISRT